MAVLRYSVLRLALFAVALLALLWLGMNPWLSPLLAAFIAWGLSYVLLPGPRDAAALEIARRAQARRERRGRTELTGRAREDADLEDAADEAVRAAQDEGADRDGVPPVTPTRDAPAGPGTTD
ncbi:MAG: DUF4229 domain-containing protein [Actinobacteria bacterium]|nr:DUF4229 domain-containing protein [Actinomycetota bacterium]